MFKCEKHDVNIAMVTHALMQLCGILQPIVVMGVALDTVQPDVLLTFLLLGGRDNNLLSHFTGSENFGREFLRRPGAISKNSRDRSKNTFFPCT